MLTVFIIIILVFFYTANSEQLLNCILHWLQQYI